MKKNLLIAIFIINISFLVNLFVTGINASAVTFNVGYYNGLSIKPADDVDPVLSQKCGDPFDSSMAEGGGLNYKTNLINRLNSYTTGGACSTGANNLGVKFIRDTLKDAGIPDINAGNIGIRWVSSWDFLINSGCYSNTKGCKDTGSGPGWDEYYKDKPATALHALIFYNKSTNAVMYQLKSNCGNPIGGNGVLVYPWSLTPTAKIKSINGVDKTSVTDPVQLTAEPGQNIIWDHTVSNSSGFATDKSVNVYYKGSGSRQSLGSINSGFASGSTKTYTSNYSGASQSNVGEYSEGSKKLCRKTQVDPWSWQVTSPTYSESAPACVWVPYKYDLVPSTSAGSSDVVEQGSSITVNYGVKNGGKTISRESTWQLKGSVTAPDGSILSNYIPASGSGKTFSNIGNYEEMGPYSQSIAGDYSVGTKICFTLSVTPRSNDNGSTITSSPPTCFTVGKKPKVQIWGGDLRSESKVQTSTSIKTISGSNYTFGSWIEYGIFTPKTITGTGSGSAYSGAGLSGNNFCDASRLSFANKDCGGGTAGGYPDVHSMPDVAASFPASVSVGMASPISGNTISAVTIGKGQWAVVKYAGTVKITGDIRYSNETLSSLSDIPQLVIIADNIDISGNVTNIDAWLIAKNGSINTCSDVATSANLSASICQNPLKVNGPVMAKTLYLRRTAGSDPGSTGDPAEIFNLRADAYLWLAANSIGNNRIQTIYTTELPPRF